LMTAHFASPSAGFIERAGTAFRYLSLAEVKSAQAVGPGRRSEPR
jgi:hypothetical protein